MDFDVEAFMQAIDTTRVGRGLTWKKVAEETGVAASSMTRLTQGKTLAVENLVKLLSWSGLSLDSFIPTPGLGAEALPEMVSLIYKDLTLTRAQARLLEKTLRALYSGFRELGPVVQ